MEKLVKTSENFFIDPDYIEAFKLAGILNIDTVFAFSGGESLHKENLGGYRTRIMFEACEPVRKFFLKRYEHTPKIRQLRNWLAHRERKSTMAYDVEPAARLAAVGINTPKTVACGSEWAGLFERRSFVITEQVPHGCSLEKRLPKSFMRKNDEAIGDRKKFIDSLADFARQFHTSGYRHRDFYLCHIFYSDNGKFTLIDLNRVFRPKLLSRRYHVKDIAQLYYSAPAAVFSRTDRLRFYLRYAERKKLRGNDKIFIKKVKAKAERMARHDLRHSRNVPFASRQL